MFFYNCSADRSDMHRALRCRAGEQSGNTVYYSDTSLPVTAGDLWSGSPAGGNLSGDLSGDGQPGGDISTGRHGLVKTVEGNEEISMIARGLLRSRGIGEINGRAYVVQYGYE